MNGLAIVLPGRGYSAQGPALRLPILAAEQAGYETTVIEYPVEALEAKDWDAVAESARRQVRQALSSPLRGRVVVLAKSLGTRVLAETADELADFEQVSVVWVTPLFGDTGIRTAAVNANWRSLIVCGEVDPFHDVDGTAEVSAGVDAEVLVLPGADHALEVEGNVAATVAGLSTLADAALDFLVAPDGTWRTENSRDEQGCQRAR